MQCPHSIFYANSRVETLEGDCKQKNKILSGEAFKDSIMFANKEYSAACVEKDDVIYPAAIKRPPIPHFRVVGYHVTMFCGLMISVFFLLIMLIIKPWKSETAEISRGGTYVCSSL